MDTKDIHKDNPFRNPQGNRFLKGLFYEKQGADKGNVMYTLKDQDHEGYPSLYRLYMEMDDLTEYEFATNYLDGWEHWQMLCDCTWFKPFIKRWREELELRATAKALHVIIGAAKTGDVQASKFILTKPWLREESSRKRGRPSKEEIEKNLKQEVKDEMLINKDFERIYGNDAEEDEVEQSKETKGS